MSIVRKLCWLLSDVFQALNYWSILSVVIGTVSWLGIEYVNHWNAELSNIVTQL